jgi:phosphoribosylglycinamide formyltransferase-1
VDAGVDTGPIVIQAAVPVLENDTVETLSARILRQEHRIYPEAIRLFAEGRLRLVERQVHIVPPLARPDETLISPPLCC